MQMRLKPASLRVSESVSVCAAKLKVITTTPHPFYTNLSTEPDPNVSGEH